jgi:peptidyl-Lys metalloendopeptidase
VQRRGRLALAACLLLAAAGCAALPPAGVVAAKPPVAADIPGPACTAEHRAVIEEAAGIARQRIAIAIRLVQQQPDHPHVVRWFGSAPRDRVAATLRSTEAWLAPPQRLKMLCNDPPACRGPRMAYALPPRQIVGLCPAFFRASLAGQDNRWGILIHEASHIAAGTGDHAYGPNAAAVLAKTDPARAAENADNYEYFVESLPI